MMYKALLHNCTHSVCFLSEILFLPSTISEAASRAGLRESSRLVWMFLPSKGPISTKYKQRTLVYYKLVFLADSFSFSLVREVKFPQPLWLTCNVISDIIHNYKTLIHYLVYLLLWENTDIQTVNNFIFFHLVTKLLSKHTTLQKLLPSQILGLGFLISTAC